MAFAIGNQQLLFIMLEVIIVGVAVVVGLDYFQTQAVDRNRDQVIFDLNSLANLAQFHYKKNEQLGGGGRSFVGFEIPSSLQSTAADTFTVINISSSRLLIEGVGNESGSASVGCTESAE